MSIDEEIEKHRRIAETKKTLYDACILKEYNRHLLREYKEHEQLAEWLEALKAYRQYIDLTEIPEYIDLTEIPEQYKLGFQDGIIVGNNKAIDDFLEAIDRADREEPFILDMYEIEQIAEQLKVGGENE